MTTVLKTLIAAAGVSILSTTAFAATMQPVLLADQSRDVGAQDIAPGQTVEFQFTAGERLKVLDFFAFTANGSNSGSDAGMATFSYDGDGGSASTGPTQTVPLGSQGISFASLPGFRLDAGQSFSLFLTSGANSLDSVDLDASFSTAAVPVPAAGLLLLTALVGGGAMARRKKAA